MLESLKRLFRRRDLPDATRDLFRSARSTRDLLEGLDRLIDRNRIAVRALERDIEGLEQGERAEAERIRSGDLAPRVRRNALRAIQRVRREIAHIEERIRIHDRNVALHQELVAKIQAVEAMRMRGVEEGHIDAVMGQFEAELDGYRSTLQTGELAVEGSVPEAVEDDEALDRLEEEILSGKARAQDPRREKEVPAEEAGGRGPEEARERRRTEKRDAPSEAERGADPGARGREGERPAGERAEGAENAE